MPRNVEMKAKIGDWEALLKTAQQLCNGAEPEVLHQHDTFFNATNGRLKIREFSVLNDLATQKSEIIFYDRPDSKGAKVSDFFKVNVENAGLLKQILDLVLGDISSIDGAQHSSDSMLTAGLKISAEGKVFKIQLDHPEKIQRHHLGFSDAYVRWFLMNFDLSNDLSNFTRIKSPEDMIPLAEKGEKVLERFVPTLIVQEKPPVTLVNGPAIGILVTVLALCDLVIASYKATFQTPFTALGQSPEGSSSFTFPTLMGTPKAIGTKGELKKKRSLFIYGQTRIHVDEVEGLGNFIELEVCLNDEQGLQDGQLIADDLLQKLGVSKSDLLSGAYIDALPASCK